MELNTCTQNVKEKNWTEKESMSLMAFVRENKTILESKFSPSVTMERKRNTWKKITDILNSMYTSQVRLWMNVKKRYSNIKQSAKKKKSSIEHPPTGNQGLPIILTSEEECYLDENSRAPSIDGIVGGMETGDDSVAMFAKDICSLMTQVCDDPISPDNRLTPAPSTSVTMAPPKPVKPDLKRKNINETKRSYEEKLLKLDITVQELKVKKLKLEIELLEIRKKQELSKTSES